MEAAQLQRIQNMWTELQGMAAQGETVDRNKIDQLGKQFVQETKQLSDEEKTALHQTLFADGFTAEPSWSPVLEGFLHQADIPIPEGAPEGGKVREIMGAQTRLKDEQPLADRMRDACEQSLEKFNQLAKEQGVQLPPDMDHDIVLNEAIDELGELKPADRKRLNNDPVFQQNVIDNVIKKNLMEYAASHLQGEVDVSAASADNGGAGGGRVPPPGDIGLPPGGGDGAPGSGRANAADRFKGFNALNGERSQMLLNLVNDPTIPIEQLVIMVVMLLAEDEDEKLRQMFKEFANHEQHLNKLRQEVKELKAQLAEPGADQEAIQKQLQVKQTEMKQVEQTAAADRMQIHAKTQYLMQRRTEMFNLMTNIIKQFHDMAMAAIRNIRG